MKTENVLLAILIAFVIFGIPVLGILTGSISIATSNSDSIKPIDRVALFCSEMAKNHTAEDRDVIQSCLLYLDKEIK